MKTTFWAILGFGFLASCNPAPRTDMTAAPTDSLPAEVIPSFEITTAIEERILQPQDKIFRIISSVKEDTNFRHTVSLHYPEMLGNALCSAAIVEFCEKFCKDFVPERKGEASLFDLWVTGLNLEGNLLSIQFLHQSFTTGAAHYNHGYANLNLEFSTARQIEFSKILPLKEPGAKEAFCESVDALRSDCSEGLEPADLKPSTSYFMDRDTLYLSWSDYEKGPSMCQLAIPRSVLEDELSSYFWNLIEISDE